MTQLKRPLALLKALSSAALLFAPLISFALSFPWPRSTDDAIGTLSSAYTVAGDNLVRLGRRYGMGVAELIEANPQFKLNKIYSAGQPLIVPSMFLLPNAPRRGIVVNLAELRLYFYNTAAKRVITFPVGIGREGWDTPLGLTYIFAKQRDPVWTVPQSIKEARLADGIALPARIGPGPENPLGGFAMRLALPPYSYLIHGSNDPSGVGLRSSSGCIRMQPEDIEAIFDDIPLKTPVMIVDQPVKVGWQGEDLYLEAHIPITHGNGHKTPNLLEEMRRLIKQQLGQKMADVDWELAKQVIKEQRGYPIKIGSAI